MPPRGYRLPDATHVGRVRLQVADLARSLDWYERVLGFRVIDRDADRASLGARDDGAKALVELHERAGARPAPARGRLGLYHFAILVPDRAALGRFVSHLAVAGVRAGSADHLVSEALYLTDPDGLGIEVYADRPRAAWRRLGRQLAMDSLALDCQDLTRAGRGERWAGMPVGTTIGHVHLHVGDLEEASAFYHHGLGLDVTVWSYPSALFLSAGGYHHHLGVNTWAGRGATPPAPEDAQLLEWTLVVPGSNDVAEAARELESAGTIVQRDGDDRLARDPWGTTLRLTAPS